MSDKYFIDTNLFVYSFTDRTEKQIQSHKLIEEALSSGNGFISYQVVQEFLNVVRKKYSDSFSTSQLLKYLDLVLIPLCKVYPSQDLYQKAVEVSELSKYSFYDSLIIASAANENARILYSEDLHHNHRLEGLTVLNPFI